MSSRWASNAESGPPRLALVLWGGTVGGAEMMVVNLAAAFRNAGAPAHVVFIMQAGSLGERLTASGVPFVELGFRRGRGVLRQPRRYAAAVTRHGPDGALLPECGFIGLALRAGGYRAPIVAVEHGALLLPSRSLAHEVARRLTRVGAAWSDDAEVAVSAFMLARMREHPHAARTYRIPNGIDAAELRPPDAGRTSSRRTVVGFVGRLVEGKGTDQLISAFAEVSRRIPATLLIAGDGPERDRLQRLAEGSGASDEIEFLGIVDDVREFWAQCDVAVFPTQSLPESFGLAALEAMSCETPVIATSVGALRELVVDGETGVIVEPGDVPGLAAALVAYADDPALRRRHGAAGRRRAVERFALDDSARRYLEIFEELHQARETSQKSRDTDPRSHAPSRS